MNELLLEILKEEEDSGRIFAKGNVDGHEQRFYVDTGSTATKVRTNEFFDKYSSTENRSIVGLGGKPLSLSKIKVQKISMGPYSTTNHEILRYPNSPTFESTAGIDLLQNKAFVFEFSKSRMIELNKINGNHNFKIGRKGHILIDTQIGNLNTCGIWDTGAGLTTIDTKLVESNPNIFTLSKELDAGDPTGAEFKMKLYAAKEIKIGNLVLKDVQFLAFDFSIIHEKLNDPNVNLAIGFNILVHHDWYFDMKSKVWTAK